MREVKNLCAALAAAIALGGAGCSSIPYGRYGLMMAAEPPARAGRAVHIQADPSIPLAGESCSALVLLIPVALGWNHMERAVSNPVEALGRPDVVGMANLEMRNRIGGFPPFYTKICWSAQGVAAVVK